MLITGRRRRRPRQDFSPQAQVAQQRLKRASAPPCVCAAKQPPCLQFFKGASAHTLLFCSSAECYFPDATAPEATPRLFAAGSGGATTAKTCACAAMRLRRQATANSQALQRHITASSILLLICRVFFSCFGSVASPSKMVTQRTQMVPQDEEQLSCSCAHPERGEAE